MEKWLNEVNMTRQIGSQIGYGNLMEIASLLWEIHLIDNGYPSTGALIPALRFDVPAEVLISTEKRRAGLIELIRNKANKPGV